MILKTTTKMSDDIKFYEDTNEYSFRFGDVLKGFVSSTPNLDNPPMTSENMDYTISIAMPKYCAIISPCCSIADQVISLSPLVYVRPSFFNNPYFAEDLTRINRPMPAEKSLPPIAWEKMDETEKQDRLSKGLEYTLLDLFIYKEHEIFPVHEVHRKNADNIFTRYYMIDFRNTFKVVCSKIKKPNVVPLEAKCLQLTIGARKDLRDKIAYYYGRVPEEDALDE
jgi:hypothetical protein